MDCRIERLLEELETPTEMRPLLVELMIDRARAAHPSGPQHQTRQFSSDDGESAG